jgi:hypothetical protein
MESRHQRVRGRRGLLVLVAALAVGLVAIPAAQSTQDQPVIAGQLNGETDVTTLSNPSPGGYGFIATGDQIGVWGSSHSGIGVKATTIEGGPALFAHNYNASGGVAIEGLNTAANWVAIWGHHDPGSFGYGVLGEAPIGVGVLGRGSDSGVKGSTDSASGSGVMAENTAGGNALTVNGKASFSRSGIITIPAGAKSFTQTGVALTNTSFVLATLQSNVARWVTSAVPNPGGSSFTINLNKPAPAGGVKVGYLIGD